MVVLNWTSTVTYYRAPPPSLISVIRSTTNINQKPLENTDMQSFVSDWCRVRRARVDWEQVLQSCAKNMSWTSKVYVKSLRTRATASAVVWWDLQPAGRFSRFFIQSRTASNIDQRVGGDSWLVRIKGKK